MPHKVWAVGEEVLAADFNTYIQEQVTPTFPTLSQLQTDWPAAPLGARAITTDSMRVYTHRAAGAAGWQLRPAARVYNSANITHTTTGTNQVLTFNSERFDIGACHDTAVNPGRLTVPAGGDGVYMIGGQVRWASNATGYRSLLIQVNGATAIAQNNPAPTPAAVTLMQVVSMYQLAAGDYVELVAYQSSGGSLVIDAAPALSPEFWWFRTDG